jgi:hypothetical protein
MNEVTILSIVGSGGRNGVVGTSILHSGGHALVAKI